MKKNKFSRALKHLKKDLSEAGPTNSMKQVYSDNPGGYRLGKQDPPKIFFPNTDGTWPDGIPGEPGAEIYVRPLGYWEEGPGTIPSTEYDELLTSDFSYSTQADNPRNTDTIIDSTTGYVKASLPPNSRDFILGPLVDSYFHNHGYDNQTRIGYIQKDTRELVILARIDGLWGDDVDGNPIFQDGFETAGGNTRRWNGQESGFTAINDKFTFDMLQWFYEKVRTGRVIKNASFFLAGGVGCLIGGGGDGQPDGSTQGNGVGGPLSGGNNAGNNGDGSGGPVAGLGGNPTAGSPQQGPTFGGPPTGPYPGAPGGPGGLGGLGGLIGGLGALGGLIGGPLGDLINTAQNLFGGGGEEAVELLSGLGDGLGTLMDMKGAINNAEANGNITPPGSDPDFPDHKGIADGALGSPSNPVQKNLSDSTSRLLSMNLSRNMSGSELRKQIQKNINSKFNFGGRGTINNISPASPNPSFNKKGDLIINDTYSFGAGGDIALKPLLLRTPFTPEVTVGEFARQTSGGDKNLENKVLEFFDRGIGNFLPGLMPKSKDPVVRMQIIIPAKNIRESTEISRERRRKILREVKQPYVLPEVKKEKYKMNFSGKYKSQNTPDVTASKQSDDMIRAKNADGQLWRSKDKYWAGYETTERMNVIQDRVGHGKWYFDSITNSNSQDYEKITERFKNTLKDRELQEHLNTLAHEKAMREIEDDYVSPFREKKEVQEQETMSYDNDPLMKKVAKRLRQEIDYPDKPSKFGYPDQPPPEMINGFHPQYGKAQVYSKLDPDSAETMSRAPTGNPDIDTNVQKARKLKSVKSVSNNESPELETPLKKRTKKKT